MIGAGALVDHDVFGRGTVLAVRGTNGDVYFDGQEGTPKGPTRTVQLKRLSVLEASADPAQIPPRSYGVYVIELRDSAELPPRSDSSKPYLYVGITENPPADRFAIHKTGGRTASKVVYTHGLYLRPDLYRSYERVTGDVAACELEQRAAADLRGQGFVVDAGAPGLPFGKLRKR